MREEENMAETFEKASVEEVFERYGEMICKIMCIEIGLKIMQKKIHIRFYWE